ncbi:ABC transporter ATP-binding protein [Thermaerobacter subterraneus]|uniref:Amino acid/amide ABC transporter ATP-binding protein 1, HAAT family n=1 Tax=Thermaerobacter subterraneus DSM 13965 TaxID=867903 RepID=K6PZX8_9FIRM|nr:ABC transporter ATP-binding protein [Thermaerobacter subterraneus]EKP94169.1 amino acid/amide ABC transporter ATP-binding protein 1, HAAT family [Thermaerobacter subterraneus DSM 13965]
MPLLQMEKVGIRFGGLKAVDGLDLAVEPGELVGLIGPNGAGKTTVFNLLTGVYTPTEGTITYAGRRINGLKPHVLARLGIARTFQNIRLFPSLTVFDNVRVAYQVNTRHTPLDSILRLPRFFAEESRMAEESLELLGRLDLLAHKDELARNLPYGLQRRLEIARALALKPRLLLLDEPAAGMNPQESRQLMELIAAVRRDFDLTVLLIEHDMSVVMGICERIYVLDHGVLIATGTPAEIRRNPRVIEAYLGEEAS